MFAFLPSSKAKSGKLSNSVIKLASRDFLLIKFLLSLPSVPNLMK